MKPVPSDLLKYEDLARLSKSHLEIQGDLENVACKCSQVWSLASIFKWSQPGPHTHTQKNEIQEFWGGKKSYNIPNCRKIKSYFKCLLDEHLPANWKSAKLAQPFTCWFISHLQGTVNTGKPLQSEVEQLGLLAQNLGRNWRIRG